MSENLTDVDQFDATISMPTSGENVSAADLRDRAIQKLANRTYNTKLRVDTAETDIDTIETILGQTAQYLIGTGSGSPSTLTASFSTGYTLASNTVEVPAAGDYLVSWTAALTTTDTTNGVEIELALTVAGVGVVATAAAERLSATAADKVVVHQTWIVQIATPSTEKLSISPGSSAGTPSVATPPNTGSGASMNVLTIRRLN